jgi:GTP-binding protein
VKARFLLSAASATDFPTTGLPEIALVGRSNVGKSSLINALTKKKIARTSAAPGKTRLANYYLLQSLIPDPPSLYLVDLPGYGYARGGAESVESFEALTRAYFDPAVDSGRRLAGVLQLVDARLPDLPQDAAAFEWLIRTQAPVAIVATKIDKLNRADQSKAVKTLEGKYGVSVLPESATNGAGLDEIWKTLRQWTAKSGI